MNTPIIVPTVTADNPLIGHPIDHSVPVATPLQSHDDQIRRDLKTKLFRPLPDSKIEIFQKWLSEINWDLILSLDACPSKKANEFQSLLQTKIDEVFPQISVRMSTYDKPWITAKLKKGKGIQEERKVNKISKAKDRI